MANNPELFSIPWWQRRRAQAIFIHSICYVIEGSDSENAEYYHNLYKWIKERIERKKRNEV